MRATWHLFALSLALLLCVFAPKADAYQLSYSYQISSLAEVSRDEDPGYKGLVSKHQLVLTDGYCAFIHDGPFNRVCFEGGPGFRFDQFAFDLHAQVTFHAIWLRPLFYGMFISAGPFTTLYPDFHLGLRLSFGAHLYFVAPALELQVTIDGRGRGDGRIFFQIALPIPTASGNFAAGNIGL